MALADHVEIERWSLVIRARLNSTAAANDLNDAQIRIVAARLARTVVDELAMITERGE